MSRERQRNSVSICLTAEKPESCIEAANRMDQHIADGTVSGFSEFYEFS